MYVCENHDDAVLVYIYGKVCPFCSLVKERDSLQKQNDDLGEELERMKNWSN